MESLAAQGALRPQSATDDKRTEPWIEWLSLLGVSSLVSVPELDGAGLPLVRPPSTVTDGKASSSAGRSGALH